MPTLKLYRTVTYRRSWTLTGGAPVTWTFYATLSTVSAFTPGSVGRTFDVLVNFASHANPTDPDALASMLYGALTKAGPPELCEAGIDDGVDLHLIRLEGTT